MKELKEKSSLPKYCLYGILILASIISASAGYLYNNAKTQATDIKACQSVGADWYYNGFNQVLCRPKKAQCKEFFKD